MAITGEGTSTGGFGGSDSASNTRQCAAKSKRSQQRCKGPAVLGSDKCRMHGGGNAQLVGTANPAFVSGRYSKFLPAQLQSLYLDAVTNPELLELADHIALLEAKIQETLSISTAGSPVPDWKDVYDLVETLTTTIQDPKSKPEDVAGAAGRLQALVAAGMRWDTTWSSVVGLMEQLRKMVDSEVKRKKELHQMVPVERVIIMMTLISDTIKRHVRDPESLSAIQRELQMLLATDRVPGHPAAQRVGPEEIAVFQDQQGVSGGRSRESVRRAKMKGVDFSQW